MSSEEKKEERRFSVSAVPLFQVVQALNGPGHLIRELQATRNSKEKGKLSISDLTGTVNPIDQLTDEYNAEVTRTNEERGGIFHAKLMAAFPGFETGEDVNGGDLVDWINANMAMIKDL